MVVVGFEGGRAVRGEEGLRSRGLAWWQVTSGGSCPLAAAATAARVHARWVALGSGRSSRKAAVRVARGSCRRRVGVRSFGGAAVGEGGAVEVGVAEMGVAKMGVAEMGVAEVGVVRAEAVDRVSADAVVDAALGHTRAPPAVLHHNSSSPSLLPAALAAACSHSCLSAFAAVGRAASWRTRARKNARAAAEISAR